MKILIEEPVLRQALEALDGAYLKDLRDDALLTKVVDSITALRAALDAAEKVEPLEKMFYAISMSVLKDQKFQDGYFIAVGDEARICEMFYRRLRHHFNPTPQDEQMKKDAERYQWLREETKKNPDFYSGEARWMVSREQGGIGNNYFGEKIDAAIDAAMAEGEK